MTVTTTFINDSKAHDAREFTDYFARFVSDGVLNEPANALQVSISGMVAKVKAGAGIVRGVMIANDSDLTLTIDTTASSRIDRVVMGVDQSAPSAGIYVLKGTDGTTTAPELANTSSKRELCLAEIMVTPNGVSSYSDTRLTSLCGVVRNLLGDARNIAGIIHAYAGSTAPDGYLMCDGSAVSRTTYAALFAAIGTTYGAGDGSTTFNLPDLQGRFPLGAGAGDGLTARTVGQKDGEERNKLTTNEIPSHNHTASTASAGDHTHGHTTSGYRILGYNYGVINTGVLERPVAKATSGNYTAPVVNNDKVDWGGFERTSSNGAHTHTVSVDSAGGGGSHNNMPPYTVVSYIISTGL